ncbi:hypothetical protein [Prescottella agglutinans]|uniref:Uncharacterized protein n=1 Tax=Prescottella agglutinans TaxID=1644129 RepID=A0ABT6M599_9NOCA|nr:hypothetical protein [Prescottella agglutinans]MDH6279496.1 hypothetical protein [Prescottella agglutinans]
MANIDLDKLEQLHATATPGPWEWVPNFGPTAIYSNTAEPGELVAQRVSTVDTRLIVEARNQLPALIAELRAARAAVETQRKVAGAYLEALQDEYRPHVEQNKAYGLVIDAQAEEIEQLRATIERGRNLAARWECAAGMTPSGPVRVTTLRAVRDLRAALDGES